MVTLSAVTTLLPGILVFTPLPVNRFRNKLALNVPNNIIRNASFCFFFFASFLNIVLTNFINL